MPDREGEPDHFREHEVKGAQGEVSFGTADNVNVSDSEEPNQRLSLSQTCWTNVNREAICSGENEQMQITVAGKEDMWDSGCIDVESESATKKKEKLTAGLSSAPLNEETKRTYTEVCTASLSNDDKGDLESTTEEEESLKIVEETKNDGEDKTGDAGKAAVNVVDVDVVATPSVTSDLSVEEEEKDNIDACEDPVLDFLWRELRGVPAYPVRYSVFVYCPIYPLFS